MFFFFDEENKSGGLTPSLLADSNNYSYSLEKVRDLLYKETEKQGLRNTDLAELTEWSPSKTSKIIAGKQKVTADDVKVWSRVLGFTPDPFINENVDLRSYNIKSYIRSVSDSLEAYFDAYEDDDPSHYSIANYELPLSILTTLGVKVSDYAVRANASFDGIDPFNKKGYGQTPTSIRFWQRTTSSVDSMIPEFGIFLSPENDYFLFAVFLERKENDGAMSQLRDTYKDVLQITESQTKDFDDFVSRNGWVPKYLKWGEILSFGASTNELPGPESMTDTLMKVFRDYCSLVWEVKGIDLLPSRYKQNELSPYQQLDILNGFADFDDNVKQQVIEREQFKCENGTDHKSFADASGKQYMEVVPIVPFSIGSQYGDSIMSADNAVCLCPNCKAQMKYGTTTDKEDMIYKLYRKHQKQLQEAGIDVSLTQVLAANGLA